MRIVRAGTGLARLSWFGPTRSSRAAASASVSPSREASSSARTPSIGVDAAFIAASVLDAAAFPPRRHALHAHARVNDDGARIEHLDRVEVDFLNVGAHGDERRYAQQHVAKGGDIRRGRAAI